MVPGLPSSDENQLIEPKHSPKAHCQGEGSWSSPDVMVPPERPQSRAEAAWPVVILDSAAEGCVSLRLSLDLVSQLQARYQLWTA